MKTIGKIAFLSIGLFVGLVLAACAAKPQAGIPRPGKLKKEDIAAAEKKVATAEPKPVPPVVMPPATTPAAPAVTPATPAAEWRVLAIHFWSRERSSQEGQAILDQLSSGVARRQSRDLSGRILEAAGTRKIARESGCSEFRVEFYDAEAGKITAATLLINGEPPKDFRGGEPIAVAVCAENGGGSLAVAVNPAWNTPRIAVIIRSQFPSLPYPKSGALRTCGPATMGNCGGDYLPGQPTVLYSQLAAPGTTHFHFVK